jgi:glycosyltransferase involved in cell wall biosynthesis
MEKPLVTVGASNYNNAAYVIETLESIKNQTYENIELIIIDDGSKDNSPTLIREWLKTYQKPYLFIEHEQNKGVPTVLNTIVGNAKGKYFSEIATDDVMMPDKISRQVEILESSSADTGCVYSDAFTIDEKGNLREQMFNIVKGIERPPSGNIYEYILAGNLWFHTGTMLARTQCYNEVGLFDYNILSEDVDMVLKLSRQYKFVYSDYVSEKYRVRGNSLTRTNTWYASQIQVLAKNLPYSKTALGRMDGAAVSAYLTDDNKALALLPQYKHLSAYIGFILVLKKSGIPKVISRILLFFLRKYLQAYRSFTR